MAGFLHVENPFVSHLYYTGFSSIQRVADNKNYGHSQLVIIINSFASPGDLDLFSLFSVYKVHTLHTVMNESDIIIEYY